NGQGEGPAPACTDRRPTNPRRTERLDLAPRQQHPRRVDLRDRASLRLQEAEPAAPLQGDRARTRPALRRAAGPPGQRAALAAAQPALTLVPTPHHLDRAGADRAGLAAATRHANVARP